MQLPDLSLLLVMVVFWAAFWILRTFLFRPLGRILEEREAAADRIDRDLEAALEKERRTLAEIDARLTAERRQVMLAREKTRQEAMGKRNATLEAARERARADVAAAQQRLESDIAKTRAELKGSVQAMALEIASQTLGRRVA